MSQTCRKSMFVLTVVTLVGCTQRLTTSGLLNGNTSNGSTSVGGNGPTPTPPQTPTPAPTTTPISTPTASPTASGSGGSAGWLYTSGNKIFVSNGNGGTPWMARGSNMDDIFFCGGNYQLSTSPDPAQVGIAVGQSLTGSNWGARFIRISLYMSSFVAQDWKTGTPAQGSYQAYMTSIINTLATGNVYVLVSLRSHSSMANPANNEAAYVPTAATDSVYRGLVDSFATNKNVLFGLANEPGGSQGSNFATVTAAPLIHAANTIRTEEDAIGASHHIISVQGDGYSRDVSYFSANPVKYASNGKLMDNVVYEVHAYSPIAASGVTFNNIPVIIGEYGGFAASNSYSTWDSPGNTNPTAHQFYTYVEQNQIPSLAWDFSPFSNCAPDVLNPVSSPFYNGGSYSSLASQLLGHRSSELFEGFLLVQVGLAERETNDNRTCQRSDIVTILNTQSL